MTTLGRWLELSPTSLKRIEDGGWEGGSLRNPLTWPRARSEASCWHTEIDGHIHSIFCPNRRHGVHILRGCSVSQDDTVVHCVANGCVAFKYSIAMPLNYCNSSRVGLKQQRGGAANGGGGEGGSISNSAVLRSLISPEKFIGSMIAIMLH